jgi:Reverse transcriptase (RNA-dependent DNA polymerase)
MLLHKIIEKSNAVYYSHPVIVQRTANTFRFCIDFRNLNGCTKPASWPVPLILALLARIGHYKPRIFGVMDLTSGFHQAPLAEAAKILTAFACFAGVYQFTRLPFGLKRAPSYCQEQMATMVLYGLRYTICEMYIDDCIVYADSNAQFLERLELISQRFCLKGLRVKAKKCKFGLSKIEYVGRVISSDGLSMSKENIEAVLDFPRPKDNTSLRTLLGIANYFRCFFPNHLTIVAPLHRMIDHSASKRSSIVWTTESITAFQDIRIAILRCPLMHYLDDVSPIRLSNPPTVLGAFFSKSSTKCGNRSLSSASR